MAVARDRDQLDEILKEIREYLVDSDSRNSLINSKTKQDASPTLEIVNELTDNVFLSLRKKNESMTIQALGTAAGDSEVNSQQDSSTEFDAKSTDLALSTNQKPGELYELLLKIARTARTNEDEMGVNTLFLAMGTLHWSDPSDEKFSSPLILLPVRLIPDRRKKIFTLKGRTEDELFNNLPLQKRLRQDFGILLDNIDLVEADENWLPSTYFSAVSEEISEYGHWTIQPDTMCIGFYSLVKDLMFRDLIPENWPKDDLRKHPQIKRLLLPTLRAEGDKGPRSEAPIVVDADSSQLRVIQNVLNNQSIVIQGPPGTGKSQTITNIIASALHDGKNVLFISEKMAALSVVHDRLKKAGLGSLCLELHSKKSDPAIVMNEFQKTLDASDADSTGEEQVRSYSNRLSEIRNLLHRPFPKIDSTPYSTLEEIIWFEDLGVSSPMIRLDGLARLSNSKRQELAELIDDYCKKLKAAGPLREHPFFGAERIDPDRRGLKDDLESAVQTCQQYLRYIESELTSVQKEIPVSPAVLTWMEKSIGDLAPYKLGYLELAAKLDDELLKTYERGVFLPGAWTGSVKELEILLEYLRRRIIIRWPRELFDILNDFKQLKKSDMVDRLKKLIEIRKIVEEAASGIGIKTVDYASLSTLLKLLNDLDRCRPRGLTEISSRDTIKIKIKWNNNQMPFAKSIQALNQSLEKYFSRIDYKFTKTGLSWREDVGFTNFSKILSRMWKEVDRYPEWNQLASRKAELVESGLEPLAEALDSDRNRLCDGVNEFCLSTAKARWSHMAKEEPEFAKLELFENDRDRLTKQFRDHEHWQFLTNKQTILSNHRKNLPDKNCKEAAWIRAHLDKKGRPPPVREIFKNIATNRFPQRVKPVMMMSPTSVAQFLPPGQVKFDLLLMDEASQIRVEDALGAIARAEKFAVVGDEQQMPPTSFFTKMSGIDPDEVIEDSAKIPKPIDYESILTLCRAKMVPTHELQMHYRSQVSSLINKSNEIFYRGNLVVPPSTLERDQDFGFRLVRVPGVYASGTNPVEARRIVDAIANHAGQTTEMSIGVVTFSSAQMDKIESLLDDERRKNETLDQYLNAEPKEPVFVKNIENVQGDERDVILISVGYGPDEPDGRLSSQNFGPVNMLDGEKRLNVLFSRARYRCDVFVSFDPRDIRTASSSNRGPAILQQFLLHASRKSGEEGLASNLPGETEGKRVDDVTKGWQQIFAPYPRNLFDQVIAKHIKESGYLVEHQQGPKGFRIDLVACQADQPKAGMLAVVHDGENYRAMNSESERDRLFKDVLESRRWNVHRIWITDWFNDPLKERNRLADALNAVFSSSATPN
ncbi:MAG: DUF4011 domain-containing protein [Albidovulum sp.]|nr:DUF4011 domain-containing protein [Albidovulum sp.]